jgi:hypothetical protein
MVQTVGTARFPTLLLLEAVLVGAAVFPPEDLEAQVEEVAIEGRAAPHLHPAKETMAEMGLMPVLTLAVAVVAQVRRVQLLALLLQAPPVKVAMDYRLQSLVLR